VTTKPTAFHNSVFSLNKTIASFFAASAGKTSKSAPLHRARRALVGTRARPARFPASPRARRPGRRTRSTRLPRVRTHLAMFATGRPSLSPSSFAGAPARHHRHRLRAPSPSRRGRAVAPVAFFPTMVPNPAYDWGASARRASPSPGASHSRAPIDDARTTTTRERTNPRIDRRESTSRRDDEKTSGPSGPLDEAAALALTLITLDPPPPPRLLLPPQRRRRHQA
jgi:hypothetical protein